MTSFLTTPHTIHIGIELLYFLFTDIMLVTIKMWREKKGKYLQTVAARKGIKSNDFKFSPFSRILLFFVGVMLHFFNECISTKNSFFLCIRFPLRIIFCDLRHFYTESTIFWEMENFPSNTNTNTLRFMLISLLKIFEPSKKKKRRKTPNLYSHKLSFGFRYVRPHVPTIFRIENKEIDLHRW